MCYLSGKKFKKSLSFKAPDVHDPTDPQHHHQFEEKRKEMVHREQGLNKMLSKPDALKELDEEDAS